MSVLEMKRKLEEGGHVLHEKWENMYFFSVVQERIIVEPEFVLFALPLQVDIDKASQNYYSSSLTWVGYSQARSEFRRLKLVLPLTSCSSCIPRSCWFIIKQLLRESIFFHPVNMLFPI
jgi:glycopeptide antibiotics resistance protein